MRIHHLMLGALLAFMPFSVGAASLYGGGTYIAFETSIHSSVSAQADMDTEATTSSQGPVNLDIGTNGLGVTAESAAAVSTDADLSVYEERLMNEDARVAATNSDSDAVSVSYWHEGLLFGLMPLKVKAETRLEERSDGSMQAETHMPWWNIFVTGTEKVSSNVDASLNSAASFSVDAKASADAAGRARLIEAMVRANLAASASVE